MPLEELTSCTATSGTTADPELIAESWDVAPPLPMVTARDLWELGLRPGDRVLIPAGSFRNFWDEFFGLLGVVPVFVDALDRAGRVSPARRSRSTGRCTCSCTCRPSSSSSGSRPTTTCARSSPR